MLAEMLLRCPVGCNFLWTIERDQVPLEQALAPEQAFERATIALRDLDPWTNRAARARSEALERGAQLEGLAHEVASHPAIHWWAAPCNLSRQVLLTDHSPLVAEDEDPQTPQSSWEDYAQRPAVQRTTSTMHGALSSADIEIALGLTRIHRSKPGGAGCRAAGEFGGGAGVRRAVPERGAVARGRRGRGRAGARGVRGHAGASLGAGPAL